MKKLLAVLLFLIIATAANAIYIEYTPLYSETITTAGVTSASAILKTATDGRRTIKFLNQDPTFYVTICPGTSTAKAKNGVVLAPYGTVPFSSSYYEYKTDAIWQGAFTAISNATTADISVVTIIEGK